jgi:hypothetical protein
MEVKKRHWMQVLFQVLRFPKKGPKASNYQHWQMKTPNCLSCAVIPTILHNYTMAFLRFYAYLQVHYGHKYVLENKHRNMCVHAHIQAYKQTNNRKYHFFVAQIGSNTWGSENRAYAFYYHPLLPCCEFNKTRRSMPLPIYRMTKVKDASAKPATSHRNTQAGGSVNGWGDLEENEGTGFSDLLEPIHAHSFHEAIVGLFPAPHIRLSPISNPGPHRPLQDSLQTSGGELKKPHFLWHESCNIMFSSLVILLVVVRGGVVGSWHSPSKCNSVGSWFHLPEGVLLLALHRSNLDFGSSSGHADIMESNLLNPSSAAWQFRQSGQ